MSLASDGSRKSLFTSYLARKARKSVPKEVPVATSNTSDTEFWVQTNERVVEECDLMEINADEFYKSQYDSLEFP